MGLEFSRLSLGKTLGCVFRVYKIICLNVFYGMRLSYGRSSHFEIFDRFEILVCLHFIFKFKIEIKRLYFLNKAAKIVS